MKTINSLISVIVLLVMLVSPLGNVSARGETEAPQQSFSKLVWESKPDMPTARYNMGAAVSGGKIYVIGGDNYTCTALSNVHEYDPVTETWTTRADMPTGRWGVGVATGPDGQIYAFGGMGGGYCGADMLTTVEAYDPATDSWATRASMPTQRSGFGVAAAINGKIYIIGGGNSNGLLATVEEYNPATDSWTQKADMPWPNNNVALAAASNGKIYVLGGDVTTEVLQEYDPEQDSWTQRASIPVSRYGVKIAQASDGRIYAVGGGIGGGYTTSVEAYDPTSDTWVADSNINTARSGHILVAVGDQIFAMGGWGPTGGIDGGPLSSVEAGTITSLPPVLYAKQDGLTSGSCESWDNACDLQYALTSAVASQEIWVAAGIYKPTTDLTDRTATFQFKNGVALYGGFAGTETTRDERNWKTNKTVLSGDIDNNDINDDGNFIAETTADIQGGNAYHVVIGNNIDNTTVLDGFTITAGQANSPGYSHGGGMFNEYYSSPILTNIVFSANMASNTPDLPGDGGGMYNSISNPILINVTFFANSASLGGGLYNSTSSRTILTSVLFFNNSAASGAGMFISDGNPELNNVVFYHNSASWSGGGLSNSNGSPRLINTTFFENSAATYGGGMDSSTYNPPSLINNIFWGNSALYGPQINSSYDSLNVTYSNVQGGWSGTGNIDADPMFADPANGDLHLQAGSPAIDSGTNTGCPPTDYDGAPRFQDGNNDGIFKCDMGAFEFPGVVPPSLPPVADAGGPYSANAGATLTLDASNSYDPEGGPLTYEWDLNSDGLYDDATGITTETSFANAGNFVIGLRVKDSDGLSDTDSADVIITVPLPNDNFVNALVIPEPLPFDTRVDDMGTASLEADEPSSSCAWYGSLWKTVWYAYTPTNSGLISASVTGAAFTPVLAAYTGTALNNLTELGCQVYSSSALTLSMEAGTTYYFQVGKLTSWDADGWMEFNVKTVAPPVNDNFVNATIAASLPFSNTVDISDATTELNEPQYCNYSPKTVWYSFTTDTSMLVQVDMSGSSFWDTTFTVYQAYGPSITDLGYVQCASFGNSASFTAQAGMTYYIQAGSIYGSGGSMQIKLQELIRPANDDFTDAKTIAALPYIDNVDISNGTRESDEPNGCGQYPPNTIWYSLTPTKNMLVQVDANGSSFWDTIITVYQSTGQGFSGLSFVRCAAFGDSAIFFAEAGNTYYIQAGSTYGSSGSLQLNLQELPRPTNDDFGDAKLVTLPLPFDDAVDTFYSTREKGEPTPSCAYNGPGFQSVWFSFTPETTGPISASIPSATFTPVLAAYTGSSLNDLVQVGCQNFNNILTFHVNSGTTYYFQVGNLDQGRDGGPMQFHLEKTPPPVAEFNYSPPDPSVFDTIQFYNTSYDPGQLGFDSVAWDFGDGTTSKESNPTHKYAKDGDYTVKLSITTYDGRTAWITQAVQVRTRDVAITKLFAPTSASMGQTRTVTVSVSSKAYPETVQIDLYRSVAGGFEFIGTLTQTVPAYNANRTVAYNFSYTFTSSDASIGKVTFYAVATISEGRDIYPADNEAYSLPTRVNKRR